MLANTSLVFIFFSDYCNESNSLYMGQLCCRFAAARAIHEYFKTWLIRSNRDYLLHNRQVHVKLRYYNSYIQSDDNISKIIDFCEKKNTD